MLSNEHALEVARYPLTDLEKDTLQHFPDTVSLELIKTLRDSVAVFHNLAHHLWRCGMRIRIVPRDKNFSDIPEYAHRDPTFHADANGMYDIARKLVVVREEVFLCSRSVKVKYATFIHEMAHAIWYLILSQHERGYVFSLYKKECVWRSEDDSYRMLNVDEFFAESFLYFVTPHRKDRILSPRPETFSDTQIKIFTKPLSDIEPDKESLRSANIEMLCFLEGKFKGLVDPELVMARPQNDKEEIRYDRFQGEQLFLPTISGTAGDEGEDTTIYNW